MIQLVVTTDDSLNERLLRSVLDEEDTPRRAWDAVTAMDEALQLRPGMILVDMTLRSADTLLEALHSNPETACVPLLAVTPDGRLPFELRRLCKAVLSAEALDEQRHS